MLPTSSAVARDFGAFIVPVGGGASRVEDAKSLPLLAGNGLPVGARNVLSVLGLPDFLRGERPGASRRSRSGGPQADLGVLGEQVTIPKVGDGDALSFGRLPLVALALVLLSSLLLVAAVLPPAAVGRTPVSEATFERLRQPLALAAIGILLPVAFVTLLSALS
jgi:hypothetical protein